MKRIVLLFMLFALMLVGCGGDIKLYRLLSCDSDVHHWEFLQDHTEVKEMKIIDATGGGGFKWEVIKELDIGLVEELYDDIQKIDMWAYGPTRFATSGHSILIVFNNGEYDIISQKEPEHFVHYDDSGVVTEVFSMLYCDEDQFNALIEKYMNM